MTLALPAWLGAAPAAGPSPLSGVRAPRSFAERTVLAIAAVLREELGAARDAARQGLLQRTDARAKIVAALLVLVAISATRSLAALAATAALAPALARASRVDVASYARRVWLVVPLFTAAVALPALFRPFTPGETALEIGPLAVTREGIDAAARLVLRAGASVSVVLLLARTTAPAALWKALRGLGAPRALVLVAAMTHRYIFLLAREAEAMHLGLLSRRISPLRGAGARAWVGGRVAVLLEKAHRTAEDVHLAMTARGFRGEWRALDEGRLGAREAALLLAAAALAAAVLLAPRVGLP